MNSTDQPNIVLITYDSLRADHCGFMGYGRETTPTLDAMAKEGLVFRNAVASGVPTIASMTAVMTGEHSLASPEIGFNTQQREQVTSRPTIAETLSEAGYATGALSPNPPASSYFGFDQGFDWFEDFLAGDEGVVERTWNRVFRNSIEGGGLSTYLRLFKNVVTKDEVLRPWADFYDEILAWRQRVEEPYFLWVLLLEPHHPWLPPAESQRWSSRRGKYLAFRQYYQMFTSGWEPAFSSTERQRLIDLYDDAIRYGDQFLSRLRNDLADDDPVFLIHADHGEEFGEHNRYGHQPYLYENLVHVPLLIWNADRTGLVKRPVELRSLAPTIATLAGTSHSCTAPSLFADRAWTTSKVFTEDGRRAAIRTERAKYIVQEGERHLYNLEVDSDEQHNRKDERPEIAQLFEQLHTQELAREEEGRRITEACTRLSKKGDV